MWPFKKKKLSSAEKKQQDYENIGKQVMVLYDHINPDRKGLYRTAFLKGVVTGLGSVIGATIVIALIAWILSAVENIWFIGPISENFRATINNRQ